MILYYTGTGNSRLLAREAAKLTGEECRALKQLRTQNQRLDCTCPHLVVAPVYGWQLPRIVEKWLKELVFEGRPRLYFLLNCGDGAGAAQRHLEELCRHQGWDFGGLCVLKMPENYTALFPVPTEEEAQAIIRWALEQLPICLEPFCQGKPFPPMRMTSLGRFLSGPVNRLFYRLVIKDRRFRVAENCSACGTCRNVCPVGNVVIENGRPHWQGNCIHCMACINFCPKAIIEYGLLSKGKRRHHLP